MILRLTSFLHFYGSRTLTLLCVFFIGACETLCEMELFEQFKQPAQALEVPGAEAV